MQQHADLWRYRERTWTTTDMTGFNVEATDGGIGKIDEATHETGSSYIVVDTGPWIFGKKVLLPAGIIDRIDLEDGCVYVNRTKDEIKNAPEFDESSYRETAYLSELGGYYGQPDTATRVTGTRSSRP
jgi:hypothetical protein